MKKIYFCLLRQKKKILWTFFDNCSQKKSFLKQVLKFILYVLQNKSVLRKHKIYVIFSFLMLFLNFFIHLYNYFLNNI